MCEDAGTGAGAALHVLYSAPSAAYLFPLPFMLLQLALFAAAATATAANVYAPAQAGAAPALASLPADICIATFRAPSTLLQMEGRANHIRQWCVYIARGNSYK